MQTTTTTTTPRREKRLPRLLPPAQSDSMVSKIKDKTRTQEQQHRLSSMLNTRHPEQLPWDVISILVHDLRHGVIHEKENSSVSTIKDGSKAHENLSLQTDTDTNIAATVSSCEHDDDNYLSDRSGSRPISDDSKSSLSWCEEEKRASKHCEIQTPEEQSDCLKEGSFFEEKWNMRYKELVDFMKKNGHVNVPHTFPENQQLARWVKRQRRQYKLLQERKPSAMTQDRIDVLEAVGFVWDSHELKWLEKIDVLKEFRREHGHCNVAVNYKQHKLGTWVKCQRRQYKLFQEGKPSAMDASRIKELEILGFEWQIRSRVNCRPLWMHTESNTGV